jgi:hypothetical protein
MFSAILFDVPVQWSRIIGTYNLRDFNCVSRKKLKSVLLAVCFASVFDPEDGGSSFLPTIVKLLPYERPTR